MTSSLRESRLEEFSSRVVPEELIARALQASLNASSSSSQQQQNSNVANGSNPYDNSAFMMFLTVIVVLVVLCYMICLWHMIRLWFCKRGVIDENAHNLVMSGRVFDLTPGQRRAVLEAIFSETSKAVTETDVADRKEKRKKRSNNSSLDGDIPKNVDIPALKSVNTLVTSEGGSDHDVEEGVLMAHEPDVPALPAAFDHVVLMMPVSSAPDWNVVQNTNGQFIIQSDRLPSSENVPSLPTSEPIVVSELEENACGITHASLPTDTEIDSIVEGRRPLPFKIRREEDREVPSPIFRRFPTDLAVPDLREDNAIPLPPPPPPSTEIVASEGGVEESKEEEKTEEDEIKPNYSSRALLSEPITFTRVESIGSAFTSEFDDETEDNVCPICLNSYHEGDVLIASKHCSHLFHKDCILEWLEKHDSCPVCRVDMITEGEMNQAATNIVGRTRMYVAVESITRSPRHVVAPNAGAHRHVLPAHRHIIAAPQTPPPSPPRGSRMGYASR